MKILIICILFVMFYSQISPANGRKERVEMTGIQIKACSIALEHFNNDEVNADLSKYIIFVDEFNDSFEVIFIPVPKEGFVNDTGLAPRGGKTKYGREIHYKISKDTFELTKRSFAK